MKVVTYIPHGGIPDRRGFAPAIAAQYLARGFSFFQNIHVCRQEADLPQHELNDAYGEVLRLKVGQAYRLLFQKWSRWDPFPLHARLAKFMADWGGDVVHAHQLEFPVDDFRRRLGRAIPVVIHAHAQRTFDPRWGTADAYVAVSDYTKRALEEKGFPGERIHVIHNGADTQRFAPAQEAEVDRYKGLLGFQGKKIVAYVGRKQENKGYFSFLEALELLAQENSNVRGVAAGALPSHVERRPEYAEPLSRARRLVERGILLDLPALPHGVLPHVFQMADVLLFPTRFSGEQHPMVLVEAMSCGGVVISAPIAGIRETVGEEGAILLDDVENPAALADAAGKVLRNPEDYRGMREKARELAVSRFDWRLQAAQLERLYFSCLGYR